MNVTLHHLAAAALPVAIGLVACAVVARVVLWTGFGDEQAQRSAGQHLEPLCIWSLGALGVYLFTRSAAGGAALGTFALAAAIGAVALALWHDSDGKAPVEQPADRLPTDTGRAPHGAAADARLWTGDAQDAPTPRRLWTRG